LVATLGCGSRREERVEKPTPPDMTELVAIYEHPTGTLNASAAGSVLDAAHTVLDRARAFGASDTFLAIVSDSVAELGDEPDGSGSAGTEAEGYLLVTRICDGWGVEPVPDATNGVLRLTLGFTELGLDAVTWGDVESCKYRFESDQVLLRGPEAASPGSLRLHFFDAPVPFAAIARTLVLFDLDLVAEIDGEALDASFDYRLDAAAGDLDVRVPVADGDVIARVSASGDIGVRAKNGDFLCDEATGTCAAR
jgi:hypothetical protein